MLKNIKAIKCRVEFLDPENVAIFHESNVMFVAQNANMDNHGNWLAVGIFEICHTS